MNLHRRRQGLRAACILGTLIGALFTQLSFIDASPARDIQIYAQPPFFSPNQLSVTAGTPLTWRNRTQEPHTIVSDDCRRGTGCSFDSGFLGPNKRYTLPTLKPGQYSYHCGIHPFMRGILTIHPAQTFSSSDI